MQSLRLGSSVIDFFDGDLTVTTLADGKRIPACPQEGDEYRRRARDLGYGDDIAAMSRDHEVAHTLIAVIIGLPESPTLRGVADGKFWPHWRSEEAAVLGLQQFARAAGVDLIAAAERLSKII